MRPSRAEPEALTPTTCGLSLSPDCLLSSFPANSLVALPESLGQCTALTMLDASHNRLATLPVRSCTARALRSCSTPCAWACARTHVHVHVYGTCAPPRLTLTLTLTPTLTPTLTLTLTLTQASLGKLSALVEAHLSFNQLRSPLPAGLGGLARLKVLRAHDSDARP